MKEKIKETTSLDIYFKIIETLSVGDKKEISKRLGITQTGFSKQLRMLKQGKGINTKTLQVIGEYKNFNFFSF